MLSKKRRMILPVLLLCSSLPATVWIYQVDPAICNGCAGCIPYCSTGALHMEGPNAVIDPALCSGCGDCVPHCIRGAIYSYWYTGISENPDPVSITLGPSPTEGLLLVTGAVEGDPVTVLDLSGRVLATASASFDGRVEMHLSDLPPGSYMIIVGKGFAGAFTLLR
jgi:ferredoxin